MSSSPIREIAPSQSSEDEDFSNVEFRPNTAANGDDIRNGNGNQVKRPSLLARKRMLQQQQQQQQQQLQQATATKGGKNTNNTSTGLMRTNSSGSNNFFNHKNKFVLQRALSQPDEVLIIEDDDDYADEHKSPNSRKRGRPRKVKMMASEENKYKPMRWSVDSDDDLFDDGEDMVGDGDQDGNGGPLSKKELMELREPTPPPVEIPELTMASKRKEKRVRAGRTRSGRVVSSLESETEDVIVIGENDNDVVEVDLVAPIHPTVSEDDSLDHLDPELRQLFQQRAKDDKEDPSDASLDEKLLVQVRGYKHALNPLTGYANTFQIRLRHTMKRLMEAIHADQNILDKMDTKDSVMLITPLTMVQIFPHTKFSSIRTQLMTNTSHATGQDQDAESLVIYLMTRQCYQALQEDRAKLVLDPTSTSLTKLGHDGMQEVISDANEDDDEENRIGVKLRQKSGTTHRIMAKSHTSIAALIQHYRTLLMESDPDGQHRDGFKKIRLKFDAEQVGEQMTLADLDVEDDDMFDVVFDE